MRPKVLGLAEGQSHCTLFTYEEIGVHLYLGTDLRVNLAVATENVSI